MTIEQELEFQSENERKYLPNTHRENKIYEYAFQYGFDFAVRTIKKIILNNNGKENYDLMWCARELINEIDNYRGNEK